MKLPQESFAARVSNANNFFSRNYCAIYCQEPNTNVSSELIPSLIELHRLNCVEKSSCDAKRSILQKSYSFSMAASFHPISLVPIHRKFSN
eukprot:scaffold5744_cov179-Ochromonas_danica.AAC.4